MANKSRRDPLGPRHHQERLALAVLLLVVGLTLALVRFRARDDLLATETARLAGQATAVRSVLAQQIQSTQSVLAALRAGMAPARPAAIQLPLSAVGEAMLGVDDVFRVDADGRVIAAGRPGSQPAAFGGLPAVRARDRLHLLLAPDRERPDSWRLLMLLPLDDGGWLGAALDTEYARVVLAAVRYAPDMLVSLSHGSGRVLMSEPVRPGSAAIDLSRSSQPFMNHRASGLETSVQRGLSALSGDERLFAITTLRAPLVPMDGELVFGTNRSVEAVLRDWKRQTFIATVLFVLLSAISAVGLALMHRRQRAASESQREQSERLALALRGADLGLWDNDFVRGGGTVNARWCEILGLAPRTGQDMRAAWLERLHPEDRERVLAAEDLHLAGGNEAYEAIYRLRHADGRWVWVLDRGKVLERAADGSPLRMAGTLLDINARMLERQALERSERRLAITLQSIGDGVIVTDRRACITRLNTTAERLTGWTDAEAFGRPLAEVLRIFNQTSGEPVANPAETVLATGRIVELANDTALIARDGRRLYIEDSAAPIPGADGSVDGVVLVFSDVTERYVARQALRERERLLAGITDALPGPVSRLDLQGRYLFANAAYREWFGADPAAMVGRGIAEIIGAPLHERVHTYLQRVRGGETVRFDVPLTTVDGVVRQALVTLLPDRDADGTVRGHFAITFDIGDLKRAEEALRAGERRLRVLLENLMTGVVVYGADLAVRDANPAALRLLGMQDLEALRACDEAGSWNLVDEDDMPLAPERYPAARARREQRRIADLVVGVQRPEGGTVWALCNAVPLTGDDGRIESVVVTFADMTARREADRFERRKREAQKLEAIGTLAGGIAHDFNNILAGILGRLTLAREDAAAGRPVHEHLEQAMHAGLRAVALVRKILEFSRGESGSRALQPAAAIVEETLDLLRAMVPAGVRLDARLPAQPVCVEVDATQLQQVLMNLATNAWHALPESGGHVEFGLERLDPAAADGLGEPALAGAAVAHLWVRDDGSGIAPELRSRIFDPFFTTKEVGKGTGLGLSVVHGIVQAHDGVIRVDSTPGAGSSFHVYLRSPEPPAPAPAVAAGAPPAPAAPLRGGRVLLVDDDASVAEVHGQLLRRAGLRVRVCSGGAEALALLQAAASDFDIVVTDYNMPDASGLDLARRIAALAPALPVVLSSGFVDDALRARAAAAGVRFVVPKEESHERLVPVVAALLAAQAGS
ncbi:hybrid sensor histidine kinase/response regulator [Rubrivivax gelatinosus]|uniref:histidine kinase n=1 Tax=Rubrivivax gelatinosus TaxID=28068 RepID=A0ABS1DR78_RUBGE|nr:hybrid sensor histidine kinase/response regulator [Rubrivivax gelatinosus]